METVLDTSKTIPSDWNKSAPIISPACSSFSSNGKCSITLSYYPTQIYSEGTHLDLSFIYSDNQGNQKTGDVNIPYSATDTHSVVVQNPDPVVAPVLNSVTNLKISFKTDDRNPAAMLTMNLSNLSTSNPAWTLDGSGSIPSTPSATSFTCSTIPSGDSTTSSCTLSLNYKPTKLDDKGSLSLDFNYSVNAGSPSVEIILFSVVL